MGTISEKLVYLNGTKQAIKQAINEDFEVIDDNTTFREYADEISSNNAKYKDLIPKETTNATNTLDISNSSGLDKALVTQYGNTYQETTTGKNLLPRLVEGTTVFNGKTYSVDENGILTMSGTPTGAGAVNIQFQTPYQITSETRYIYLLNDYKDGTFGVRIMNENTRIFEIIPNPENRIVDLSQYSGQTITNIQIYQNLTFTATRKIYLMICTDNNQTTYEPYTNGVSPNPDYPQEIVNISGKSNVKVAGKNLFDKDNTNIINAYINISVLKAAGESGGSFYIPCEPNTTYTVSKTELFGNDRFCVFDTYRIPTAGDTILSYVGKPTGGNSDTSLTITTNATATYLGIFVKAGETSPAKTFQEIAEAIQVEKNPTASEYEPYQEQSFDLDLKSKNLFDGILELGNFNTNTGEKVPNSNYIINTNPIPVEELTNYKISSNGTGIGVYVFEYKEDLTYNLSSRKTINADSYLTTNSGTKYINFRTIDANTNLQEKIQVEKGTATEYEPFYNINLCKIGNYKDRIYPLNGKWYLEKKINKVVLNGSDESNWNYTNTCLQSKNEYPTGVISPNASRLGLSTRFICKYYATGITTSLNNGEFGWNSGKCLTFKIDNMSSKQDYLTWLSTHNTIVYYILATPTTEEITESNYPTLYNQLNNIKLYEGVNHITMTNESGLDVEFDITYYKDWKLD